MYASGHTLGVTAVAITASAEQAISASGDGTMKVWDSVAITQDGTSAVSGSEDNRTEMLCSVSHAPRLPRVLETVAAGVGDENFIRH
jgi:hypothetical protein